MKYYKDSQNNLYGFLSDGSQDKFIGKNLTPITPEEHQSILEKNEQDAFNSLNYTVKRQTEYPSIGDQLDALYKAGLFPADMAAKIKAVKDKYPKQ